MNNDNDYVYRKENFMIGTFHGTLNPKDQSSEAKLRNDIYLVGMLHLNLSKIAIKKIRLVSYEMPLENKSRGKAIDLFGYDQGWIPYIIELKKENSTEDLNKIFLQLDEYSEIFENNNNDMNNKIKEKIEKEIGEKYHIPNFAFKEPVKKVVLIPRSYYNDKEKEIEKCDIDKFFICSIGKIDKETDDNGNINLIERLGSTGRVNLKIHNK